MTVVLTANTAEGMEREGARLGATLPGHAVLVLTGELGAGKTTFVKGLAEGLGVARAEEVTSPTYTLIHEYRGAGRCLYHIDLYRLDTTAEMATLGLDDILAGPAGEPAVIALEWGEKIEAQLARPYLKLQFREGEHGRQVEMEWKC